jgi:hypothetical protein
MDRAHSLPLIPDFMVGEHQKAKRRCVRIFKRVASAGSWTEELRKCEWMDIRALSGSIYLEDRYVRLPVPRTPYDIVPYLAMTAINDATYIPLEYIPDECSDAWKKRSGEYMDAWHMRMRPIVFEQLGTFWMSLAILTGSHWMPLGPMWERDRALLAKLAFPPLLRWWPMFVALEPRMRALAGLPFWHVWSWRFRNLLGDMGLTDEENYCILQSTSREDTRQRLVHMFEKYGGEGGLASE